LKLDKLRGGIAIAAKNSSTLMPLIAEMEGVISQ